MKISLTLLYLSCQVLSFMAITPCMAQSAKPNVVLIMADDIGLGDLSYYHTRRTNDPLVVSTPNLDRLAESGMRFTDAHSPASLCAPTRFAMITGNYSFRNAQPFGVWTPEANDLIEPDHTTVARIAKAGGYKTAFLGKWGLGGVWKTRPVDYSSISHGARYFGFDYALELPQGIQNTPFAFYLNGNFYPIGTHGELTEISPDQTHYTWSMKHNDRGGLGDSTWDPTLAGPILAEHAVKYIEEHAKSQRDKPFFMYYCTQAVHIPHTPPTELNGVAIAGATIDKHGDMIYELDVQVGMIVDALEANGLSENTLLVFTSDNGGLGWSKPMRDAGHVVSNGLRGSKGSIYEGGHRVPFIAVWPGQIAPDSESHVPIVGLDMVATIAGFAGKSLDRTVVRDSVDLLPMMLGKDVNGPKRVLVHQSGGANPHYALREGPWKLILRGADKTNLDSLTPVALFNLESNSLEEDSRNMIEDSAQQDRVTSMYQRYRELRLEDGETLSP